MTNQQQSSFAKRRASILTQIMFLGCLASNVAASEAPKKHRERPWPVDTDTSTVRVLSMDLEQTGQEEHYAIFWVKPPGPIQTATCGPMGDLRLRLLRERGWGGDDEFNLGVWQDIEHTATYKLKGRTVFVAVENCCGAAPGERLHFFSSNNGLLYRVHFHSKSGRDQLVLEAYHVAGSAAKGVGFKDGGQRITTSEFNEKDEKVFTEFEWDGSGYQETKSETCHSKCADFLPSFELGKAYWQ